MKKRYSIALILLAVLTLISLAVNAAIIVALLRAQQAAQVMVADTRSILIDIGDETFSYVFKIDEEIPFKTVFPFKDEFTVPVQTTIPINTTIVVPIDLGITTYNLKVPINMVFPVDMEFTVPIDMEIPVDITVPVSMEVPIDIPLRDLPLIEHLDRMDTMLGQVEDLMTDPFGLNELFPKE